MEGCVGGRAVLISIESHHLCGASARALRDGQCPIDLPIISATNQPLEEKFAAGELREDLFFRLSVFRIAVPPMRERGEDIPALAEHFLRLCIASLAADLYFSDEAVRRTS